MMALIGSEAPPSSCTAPIRRRSDVLPLDLLINFLPGITRVGARDCEGGFGICVHRYVIDGGSKRGPSVDRKSKVLQNNLRLAGNDPCESLAVMHDDRWMDRNPKTGAFIRVRYSFYSPNCTHSTTKSCRAVARVDTGLSKKKIGVPMW
jgi:hypothetical protein